MSEIPKSNNELYEAEKEKANQAFQTEDYEKALKHFIKAIEVNPDDAETLSNIGLIHLSMGDFDDAEKNLIKCLEINKDVEEAYFNLGCLYQEKAEYEKALSYYKEVIERRHNDVETFLRMGVCAKNIGRNADAFVFYEEAFRLNPNSLETGAAYAGSLLEKGENERAEEVLQTNLVSFPENVQLIMSIGFIQKDLKKYESAMASFYKAVQVDPQNAQAFYHLADCCVELDLLDQAESFYANAFKIDNNLYQSVYSLAKLYEVQNKEEGKIASYNQWIHMVKSQLWNLDDTIKQEFVDVSNILIDYYQLNKKSNELNEIKDILASVEKILPESSQKQNDFEESLTIDD